LNCHSVTDANKQFCGVLQEFCGVYTFEAFVNWTFSSVVVSLHKLQSPQCWYVCMKLCFNYSIKWEVQSPVSGATVCYQ